MAILAVLKEYNTLVTTVSAIVLARLVTGLLLKAYNVRSTMLELKRKGLPMPPYNPIFGHLLFCAKVTSKIPADAHPNYLPLLIRQELPDLGPIFYIDTWPFGPLMLYVGEVGGLYQLAQEHCLAKYHAMKPFLAPITRGLDIVTMEGATWKKWRGIFNPGFSTSHLMTLTGNIIEETQKFCDILQKHADEKTTFRMKDMTDNLAMDVIGRVALDMSLDCQRKPNPLVNALRTQVRWLTFGVDVNPFKRFNPIRPFVHWYNLRRMDQYVSRELDSKLAQYQSSPNNPSDLKKTRSIIDLALAAYLQDSNSPTSTDSSTPLKIDSTFRSLAMSQIKLFLFSGHDTTSSTICYLFYCLHAHPEARAELLAEHNRVLGSSLPASITAIQETPPLLNNLPYTTAFIKETLRLYPAVSSVRAGEPDFFIHSTDSNTNATHAFPTANFMVWANPLPVQRDPAYWPDPHAFLPNRWLVSSSDPLHPVKGAWRPFEFGPRNCIGQELAMLEMKIVLVLCVRRFCVVPVYEELSKGKAGEVCGERAYQIGRAQPSGDLPCRVSVL